MNDPHNLGLGELGQRVQAMADPMPDPRLRPYQGTAPAAPVPNGRQAPSLEAYEHIPAVPASPASTNPTVNAVPSPAPYSAKPYSPQAPRETAREVASVWEPVAQPGPAASQAPQQQSGLPAATPPAASVPASSFVDPNVPKTGIQRAFDALRSTIPLVQKLLPLIDSNIATAVGALMTSHPHPAPQPAPPQVRIDLEPVERGLAEVRNSNRDLRNQIAEQATNFKRVEDQLDRVREATDRNTLEQQELVEDLRSVGSRISTFAIIGVVVLLVSLGLNIYLIVQLQHILR